MYRLVLKGLDFDIKWEFFIVLLGFLIMYERIVLIFFAFIFGVLREFFRLR